MGPLEPTLLTELPSCWAVFAEIKVITVVLPNLGITVFYPHINYVFFAQKKVAVKVQRMTDARTKKKALEIIAGIQRYS